MEPREELLDAGQLVRNIASAMRATFSASHQQLDISVSPQPLHVLEDRARLTQVFSNLLYNANRYTPAGGRVSVDVSEEQAEIVVRIRDTGIGIPHAIPAAKVSRSILIADDNEDAAISLSVLLETAGHQTRVVHDGTAALQVAEEMQPDVAILDIGMPGLNGYEVARRIAAQPWARKTLLVALTGWGQEAEADRRQAKDAGFHHHFVKPVEPDALFELLSHRLAEVRE